MTRAAGVVQVYCSGELLAAVQMCEIFEDCKEFVDMPMRKDPEHIIQVIQETLGCLHHSSASYVPLRTSLSSLSSCSAPVSVRDRAAAPVSLPCRLLVQAFHDLPVAQRKDPAALRDFLHQHFDPPGSDIVPHIPHDHTTSPLLLGKLGHNAQEPDNRTCSCTVRHTQGGK
jgi:hypothetical protein